MAQSDQTTNQILDIVNCARTWQEVKEQRVYICPARGTAYQHQPAHYFGVYYNRSVQLVANIEAVVEVTAEGTAEIKWQFGGDRAANYQTRAIDAAKRLRPESDLPVQVFILDVLQATDFKKDTAGSMVGTKKYIDVSSLGVDSAGYLAGKLSGKKWSDFQ